MILKVVEEIAEPLLIVIGLYVIFWFYVLSHKPAWSKALCDRRFKMLFALILTIITIKVSVYVINGESGLIDRKILIFMHTHVADSMSELFELVTLTGSSKVLFPLTAVTVIVMLYQNHRQEAILIGFSVITSVGTIYVIKMIVNRSRPELWTTEWYWGSSFPSGHTLAVTAYATSVVLCLSRIRADLRFLPTIIATIWVLLVAISRLVLGVHWPTDVFVAICIGALLPIAISGILTLSKS